MAATHVGLGTPPRPPAAAPKTNIASSGPVLPPPHQQAANSNGHGSSSSRSTPTNSPNRSSSSSISILQAARGISDGTAVSTPMTAGSSAADSPSDSEAGYLSGHSGSWVASRTTGLRNRSASMMSEEHGPASRARLEPWVERQLLAPIMAADEEVPKSSGSDAEGDGDDSDDAGLSSPAADERSDTESDADFNVMAKLTQAAASLRASSKTKAKAKAAPKPSLAANAAGAASEVATKPATTAQPVVEAVNVVEVTSKAALGAGAGVGAGGGAGAGAGAGAPAEFSVAVSSAHAATATQHETMDAASTAAPPSSSHRRRRSGGKRHARRRRGAPVQLKRSDFQFGRILGEGAYAKVMHCRLKLNKEDYAVKVMLMSFIQREGKVQFVMTEKRVMSMLDHPNVVKLKFAFKDKRYLYLVMELCQTTLLSAIQSFRGTARAAGVADMGMNLEQARWYAAQLVTALQYLHEGKGVIHRDLKPENVLLDDAGKVKITDFGSATDAHTDTAGSVAFCGTAEYVSPEVLDDIPATAAVDMWALGCILYQMLIGRPPFHAATEYLTFQQILGYPSTYTIDFPATCPAEAVDMIKILLSRKPSDRFGKADVSAPAAAIDYAALKAHPFWGGKFCDTVKAPPPYKPPPAPEQRLVDGKHVDWEVYGEATVLKPRVRQKSVHQVFEELEAEATATPGSHSSDVQAHWMKHLEDGEQVLHSSVIEKRAGLFSRTRQLVLTNKPRLIYFSPSSQTLKGEIPWTDNIHVVVKDHRKFKIITGRTTYRMTEILGTPDQWHAAIESVKIYAATRDFAGGAAGSPSARVTAAGGTSTSATTATSTTVVAAPSHTTLAAAPPPPPAATTELVVPNGSS